MTNTLIARGGALSALALVLSLAVTPVAAEAQSRADTRTERQQARSESRSTRQVQRVERRSERRAERPERVQRAEGRGGFGSDVARRAQRAGEPDARPVSMLRDDRPARRAEQVERRSERRAERIDRRTEQRADRVERQGDRRADRLEWQGRDRAAQRVERRSEQRAEQIERRGDQRSIRVEQRTDRRADRIDRRDGWRDGRRDGNWRDGRRDRDWRDDRSDYRRDKRNWRRDDWRWNYRGWAGWDNRDFRRWDRGWRSSRRYNWADFRRGNRFVYHPGPYYAPFRAHRYNRLQIGFFLDSLFFQPRFFINDPWDYRLPPVYGPYRWVRYYDDVLLVDIYSGEVVDVIYDFFW
jgi:hypothetical protein